MSSSTASIAGRELEGGLEVVLGLAETGWDFTPSAKVSPVRWRSVADSLAGLLPEDLRWGGVRKGRQTDVAAGKKSSTASLANASGRALSKWYVVPCLSDGVQRSRKLFP